MQLNEINFDFFQDKLDSFLQQLFQEINKLSGAQPWKDGSPVMMENYLYEINSFYYRSFNERFFPLYRHELKEELSSLLGLKRQQDMIKKDIMANLQRYARLYNQVKSLNSSLQQAQENCSLSLETLGEKEKEKGIELYYRLQKVHDAIKYLHRVLYHIKQLQQDKEALAALRRESSLIILMNILKLRRDNPEELDYYYQWMRSTHQWNNALLDLLENQADLPEKGNNYIARISREYQGLKAKAHPSFSFVDPYSGYLLSEQLEIMGLSLESLDKNEILRLIKTLQSFFSASLLVMNKALANEEENYNSRTAITAMLDYLYTETINPSLNELDESLSRGQQSLGQIIKDFPSRGQIDIDYFLERSREIINESYPAISAAKDSLDFQQNSPLLAALYRAELELSFLRSHIELLEEKQQYDRLIQQNYLQLAALLAKHREWMANFTSDLERLLAPRNLARSWKDLSLRVEKINLQKGQIFPADFRYLLDKYQVASRISAEEADTILEEEGDIFIFMVEDLQEEVVPFFVLSAGAVLPEPGK